MTSLTYLGGIIFILNGLMSRESDQEHIICGLRKLGVLRILWERVLRSRDQLRIGGVCCVLQMDFLLTPYVIFTHKRPTYICVNL